MTYTTELFVIWVDWGKIHPQTKSEARFESVYPSSADTFILAGISVFPPMFAASSFKTFTPFVEDCFQYEFNMFEGTVSEALMVSDSEHSWLFSTADVLTVPLIPIANRMLCGCFERYFQK